MTASSQNCSPSLRFDVGAVADALSPLLPAGFYYKTFMAERCGKRCWTRDGRSRSCRTGPLDLHCSAFPAGHCAQSLLGHINALLYRPDERPMFVVMVARSLAADAWDELNATAHSDRARMR